MATRKANRERVPVTVRVPATLLKEIDSCVDGEELPVSRNHWIVEALVEKLKRTKNGNGIDGSC